MIQNFKKSTLNHRTELIKRVMAALPMGTVFQLTIRHAMDKVDIALDKDSCIRVLLFPQV